MPRAEAARVAPGQRADVGMEGGGVAAASVQRRLPQTSEADQSALFWIAPAVKAPTGVLGRFGNAAIETGPLHRAVLVPDVALAAGLRRGAPDAERRPSDRRRAGRRLVLRFVRGASRRQVAVVAWRVTDGVVTIRPPQSGDPRRAPMGGSKPEDPGSIGHYGIVIPAAACRFRKRPRSGP